MIKKLISALILIGVSSIIAQIVIIRELLVIFAGNELSIGIILANWLFWTTVGSWFGGFIAKRIQQPVTAVALLEILLFFFLIAVIFCSRVIKLAIPSSPGEIMGIVPMWFYSFFLLAGVCLTNGALFVFGCRAYEKIGSVTHPEQVAGRVYIYESVGAGAGGLVCSFILVKYFNSFQIVWFLAIANIFIAGLLWRKMRYVFFCGVLILVLMEIFGFVNILDSKSHKWQWKGYELAANRNSIYGNITVTKKDSVYSFYENGILSFSVPDKLYAEEACHFALLQHSTPKKVLLISGGAGGILEEILKYPSVQSIDYVELDPLIITLAKNFLPQTLLSDPKVHIFNVDGRRFLNNTPGLYDVIISNAPDPNTAQINRFYTKEFFIKANEHLTQGGVLSIGVVSSENYISPELSSLLQCIYYTLKSVFPEVKVLPGDYCRFIAAKEKGFITDDYKILQERLHVNTQFVRDYYIKDKLDPERLEYIYKQLNPGVRRGFVNTDFHPVCYYFNTMFWSTYFNSAFKKIFQTMANIKLWHFFVLIPIVLLLPKIKKGYCVLLSIMTGGLTGIGFQVLNLLAFQAMYGYVYYKLGIIFTSFMIGLALGSYYINRITKKAKDDYALFLRTQAAIVIYPLLLPVIFYVLASVNKLSFLGENIIFPYLPIIAGFIGGIQFPLGNRIYLSRQKDISTTAGITYGIDLLGSCIGVLLLSVFILPILGITQTCFVIAIINLSVLIMLVKAKDA